LDLTEDYLILRLPLQLDSVGGSCGEAEVEATSAHSSVLGKDATIAQDGHAFMACAETSRNSFSVAPLAD
jgi:hypothetical protein